MQTEEQKKVVNAVKIFRVLMFLNPIVILGVAIVVMPIVFPGKYQHPIQISLIVLSIFEFFLFRWLMNQQKKKLSPQS
jgi:hypothetical protein